ncbi:hypothetical protein E2C01_098031 [Portunus trituberculatus]|uniref:Uncharacterized protein n=1 Tax=Portunus trituberculatus TaxID=210409 RepID=A0A5B7K7B6_PORTR|nr:hypothetical protein [Portunus trituberculatus]
MEERREEGKTEREGGREGVGDCGEGGDGGDTHSSHSPGEGRGEWRCLCLSHAKGRGNTSLDQLNNSSQGFKKTPPAPPLPFGFLQFSDFLSYFH